MDELISSSSTSAGWKLWAILFFVIATKNILCFSHLQLELTLGLLPSILCAYWNVTFCPLFVM
jgi:hypothetical protein